MKEPFNQAGDPHPADPENVFDTVPPLSRTIQEELDRVFGEGPSGDALPGYRAPQVIIGVGTVRVLG